MQTRAEQDAKAQQEAKTKLLVKSKAVQKVAGKYIEIAERLRLDPACHVIPDYTVNIQQGWFKRIFWNNRSPIKIAPPTNIKSNVAKLIDGYLDYSNSHE